MADPTMIKGIFFPVRISQRGAGAVQCCALGGAVDGLKRK